MRDRFDPASLRSDFPGLEGVVHLNSASMGVAPACALAAVEKQLEHLRGGLGRASSWGDFVVRYGEPVEAARREAARLLGARDDEVGLVGDTTSGLHQALDAIPFRDGDNVLFCDLEYPQVGLAAANAARSAGVELRLVPNRGGRLSIDAFREMIDRRTRALLVSSVGWVTGERADLAAFSTLAREQDLFLVADAVQQAGGVGLDLSSLGVDFLMAGGYKWLNAPFGSGLFYVARGAHERGLRPRRVGLLGLEAPPEGWESFYDSPSMQPLPSMSPQATVRVFEAQGTPNRLGSAGLAASLAYRNGLDSAAVDRHVESLAAALAAGLEARGVEVLTPRRARERAGIVTFRAGGGPRADAALRDFLAARRIFVSTRYCSGVGGVRAAVTFFNVADDLDRLFEGLDAFRREAA